MNATAIRLSAGDVIELEMNGEFVTAMILLASHDTVIFDLCDGSMPLVARPVELANVRVFDGLSG